MKLFFGVYLIILGGTTYLNIDARLALNKFDLNNDGFFSGEEVTPDMEKAMQHTVNDTARNFAFLTGLIYAGIVAFFTFVVGKISEYRSNRRIKTMQTDT